MKIPATVVTGFLGAGKTTLIRHLVSQANGRRLALVINEFGDLGIDREVLLGCGVEGCEDDDIVELPNGCICCTVADEFLPTMERLLDQAQPPDHIVIETSGLALPKPLVKAFNWPDVRARVTVDGVIAVVDAPAVASGRFADDPAAIQAERQADPNLDHDSPLTELFEDQLACADLVLLNKTDLLDDQTLGAVRAQVQAGIRPATHALETRHGAADPRVVLGLVAAAEDDLEARPSHHESPDDDHDHDDFVSFVTHPDTVADASGWAARVSTVAAAHDVLRIKGFVPVPGKDMRLVVQAVGPRVDVYFDRPWGPGEDRRARLVVIAEKGIDEAAVRAAMA